ncbi:TetR/AcrR family transcriptional regulator [Microbacterium nymphoidis]|uniref:TetR/AcrR family transcriptional regulator n=1 Tax=Microbacterium nymphoidis TaxID=2898586 RepID=UPI001E2CFADA|nr:TetR/AcrR family transcriptional regulator [Microbacterium nymphoidis]MCD2498486.1 TetR/AcrR family transcriptional regulator [Microbacterium nymphoidis]
MAWDTAETRRKLLTSATEHFARSGFAGARVDAIARDAGVNKERIYQYFGDKAGLFAAVLDAEVNRLLDGIDLSGRGGAALGALAGDLHDRASEHPELTRLLLWESLELDGPVSAESRAVGCSRMVAAIEQAAPRSTGGSAAETLLSIIAIAFADSCLPHLTSLITPNSSREARRAAVVYQASTLA